jgi:Putative DNA-binding domain/EC042_2821-lke REase
MADHDKLAAALVRTNECADVDFKTSFDVNAPRDWLEIIKDIAAMANSGGGFLLVGMNDDASPSGNDVTGLLSVDPADLANRIHKYTTQNFTGVELIKCEKSGHEICAVSINAIRVPLVFTRVGEFELQDAKKKTVFAMGTVYFRHGAKSEPGTSEDLRLFLEREIERVKESWLGGIAKVVEAPVGSRFAVLPPAETPSVTAGALPMQLTNDPTAPAYYAVPIDKTHPYRQKEVVREVNRRLAGTKTINAHDILCIRRAYSVQRDVSFCYTQNYATPRYSDKFVDWIGDQFLADASFFDTTKIKFDELKAASSS